MSENGIDTRVADFREAVAQLVEDQSRFNFIVEHEYVVRKLRDTDQWMLLDRDGYPITGGEHDTARAAIDEWRIRCMARNALVAAELTKESP